MRAPPLRLPEVIRQRDACSSPRCDRLLGPMAMTREYGLHVDHLPCEIAAAFLFGLKFDPESVEMIGKVDEVGIECAVAEYIIFEEGSDVHGKTIEAYMQELRTECRGRVIPSINLVN